MVLSSLSRCMILSYGRVIRPSSSYLWSWYVEFMGRKMYAYLGYLYCLAAGWSKTGSVLSQIQVLWNMGILEGMEWMVWMASHLFELHNLQLEMESGLLFFFFSLSLFLKKITPLSFAEISWILFGVLNGEASMGWTCGVWDGDCGDI